MLFRLKEDYDGAEPAATSVAVHNLIVLAHLGADEPGNAGAEGDAASRLERQVRRAIGAFASRLEGQGRAVPLMAAALSAWHAGVAQVVVTGDATESAGPLLDALATHYLPFAIVLPIGPAVAEAAARALPFVEPMTRAATPAAYVCRDFTCERPVTSAAALEDALARARARG